MRNRKDLFRHVTLYPLLTTRYSVLATHMENLLTRHHNLSVLGAVLAIQIIGLAVQIKRNDDMQQTRLIRVWSVTAITPFEKAIVYARNDVYGVWHNYLYLRGVRQENRELKAQIEQLRLEQVRLSQDASQARRLQTLLGFKEQSILQTLPAQVVGSSGSEQSRSVFLDKGEADGLKKNMAVITSDGVAGKVLQVYPHTAQVLLINDQTSGLGAIVERLRLQGIVRGSPAGETMLEKVMADEEVQAGDKIITTGGDGIFPKGLPVGTVVKVASSDLFLKIRVHPAADLSRLEEVLVITKLQEVAASPGDVAGSQRAVDILAARLPGVPAKPETTDKRDANTGESATTPSPVPATLPKNGANPNPPKASSNAAAKPTQPRALQGGAVPDKPLPTKPKTVPPGVEPVSDRNQ